MLLAELKDDDRILAEVLTEFKALVVALDNLRGKFGKQAVQRGRLFRPRDDGEDD